MGVNDIQASVWQQIDGPTWGKVGELAAWTSLSYEHRHLQAGQWSLVTSWNEQAAKLGKKRMITFDFRGQRFTGVVEHLSPRLEDNGIGMEIGGSDALTLLGDVADWPLPNAALSAQSTAHYTVKGAAETALGGLIDANYGRLYEGGVFQMAPVVSQGRGISVSLNERFSNLLTVVTEKCALANLGVRVGLVQNGAGTRADLTTWFFQPQDRSVRVRLSQKIGTLRTWTQSDDAPTATRAIAGGGGKGTTRIFRERIDAAAEDEWGRRREVFVDARDTTDTADLDERADSELVDATAQSSFELEATDAEGMRYGDHYVVSDSVAVEVLDQSVVLPLGAAAISADSSGVTVTLRPGNPDASDPLFAQAALFRSMRRRLRALETEES